MWYIHYHIMVFPVKNCKALLAEALEAIGRGQNHIHPLCSAHLTVAPGWIVQMFKRVTAREIFQRKPAVKPV